MGNILIFIINTKIINYFNSKKIINYIMEKNLPREDYIEFLIKYLNKIDIDKKNNVCRILLYRDINLKHTPNGPYIAFSDLNNDLIYDICSYIYNIININN